MKRPCAAALIGLCLAGSLFAQEPFTQFLGAEFTRNAEAIHAKNQSKFREICLDLDLDPEASANVRAIDELLFLHALFTGEEAVDAQPGGVLRIPYYWHYVRPNPRHSIVFLERGVPLKKVKPPPGFERYASYADLDRLPSVFLGDLVEEKPKFNDPRLGDFYTFGWCSEREMAFNTLLRLLGHRCKIHQHGIHVQSEVLLELRRKDGCPARIFAIIDNTFGYTEWKPLSVLPEAWAADLGDGPESRRYNGISRSKKQLASVRGLVIGKAAAARIQAQIDAWLRGAP